MRALHLGIGILVLIIFLFSGYYMLEFVPELPNGERMAWRANHIYLMMISVAHLLLGAYYSPSEKQLPRAMQTGGSLLMLAAAALSVLAFFFDTATTDLDARVYSYFSAVTLFAGTLLHIFGTWLGGRGKK